MARHSRKGKGNTKVRELVAVAYVADMEEAREYEMLLRNNDIPAMIQEQPKGDDGDVELAVMVPEEYADEAHVVIESQDAYDDFYDFSMDDDEDLDFDDDLLDDPY